MSDARERVEGHRIKVRYLAKQLERLAKADRDDDNAMWCAAIDVRSALMNLTRTGLNTVDADRILNALRDSEGREDREWTHGYRKGVPKHAGTCAVHDVPHERCTCGAWDHPAHPVNGSEGREVVAWEVQVECASGQWYQEGVYGSYTKARTMKGSLVRNHGIPEHHIRTVTLVRRQEAESDTDTGGEDG